MNRSTPSFVFGTFRLVVLSLLALALLLGTGLLFAAVLSLVNDDGIVSSRNLSVGLVCGLIGWLFAAVFHLRRETVAIAVRDREHFVPTAKLLLAEMGYDVTLRNPKQLSTRPRFHSLLLGGGIEVLLDATYAHLTGPKLCVELLRHRLRVSAHLGLVQQSLREKSRITEKLVKRAELRLRIKPHLLAELQTNVVDVLMAKSDVVCEVSLLAQSERGIPESTLDFQIDRWLEQNASQVDVHKHFIQLHKPLSSGEIALPDAV